MLLASGEQSDDNLILATYCISAEAGSCLESGRREATRVTVV